jgi:hypothetical protein
MQFTNLQPERTMRTLKLNPELLSVETFEAAETPKVQDLDSLATTGGPDFCPYYCPCESAPYHSC